MDKASLRREVLAAMTALAPRQRALEEELVNAAVMAQPEWRDAGTVLVYRDVAPEFSVVSAANHAFRTGKRVCLPRVEGKGLVLHEVQDWLTLRPGAFGIPEPPATAAVVAPSEVDVALVPGVAFATDGRRLGRGGGFFDRLEGGRRWGCCFDVQIRDVPVEPHDLGVERVFHASNLDMFESA